MSSSQQPKVTRTQLRGVIMQDIDQECKNQDARWGIQRHLDGTSVDRFAAAANGAKWANDEAAMSGELTWLDILHEEVTEAFAETDHQRLKEKLLQVAAVATQWALALDVRAIGEHEVLM